MPHFFVLVVFLFAVVVIPMCLFVRRFKRKSKVQKESETKPMSTNTSNCQYANMVPKSLDNEYMHPLHDTSTNFEGVPNYVQVDTTSSPSSFGVNVPTQGSESKPVPLIQKNTPKGLNYVQVEFPKKPKPSSTISAEIESSLTSDAASYENAGKFVANKS